MKLLTIDQLLEAVIHEKLPGWTTNNFLSIYLSYCGPFDLFLNVQKVLTPKNASKIIEFVYDWLSVCNDLNRKEFVQVIEWLEKSLKLENINRFKLLLVKNFLPSCAPAKIENSANFVDFSSTVISQAITSFEHRLFRDIPRQEFFQTKNRPTITIMIDHFNKFSMYIATQIVTTDNSKQIPLVEKFILIAEVLEQILTAGINDKECENLGNYNAVMEIIAGLSNVSVQRLRYIWDSLSDKYHTKLQNLEDLMSTRSNYSNYRKALKKKKPAVPYLGIYLRDLLFISEGNPKFLASGEINLTYAELMRNSIEEIESYQKSEYKLPNNSIAEASLSIIQYLNDEDLYIASLKWQPSLFEDDPIVQVPEELSLHAPDSPSVIRARPRAGTVYNVTVPRTLLPQVYESHSAVVDYFKQSTQIPHKGIFRISNNRYILLRANSISRDFYNVIKSSLGEDTDESSVRSFLYDVAYLIGQHEANQFGDIAEVVTGFIFSAFTGWSLNIIQNASNLKIGPEFCLYYEHSSNCESSGYVNMLMTSQKPTSNTSTCTFNCGFQAGWTSHVTNLPLDAVEISCKSKGDKKCAFIMGHKDNMVSLLSKYDEVEGFTFSSAVKEQVAAYISQKSPKKNEDGLFSFFKKKESIVLPTNGTSHRDTEVATKIYSQISKRCFRELLCQPSMGKISFANERYILLPADAIPSQLPILASSFSDQNNAIQEYTDSSIFQVMSYVGSADCKYYTKFMGKDLDRNNRELHEIMVLPPVISNTGWGRMSINMEEMKLQSDNFFMNFTINSSAETESCEGSKKGSCCSMIGGYVAGWLSTVMQAQLIVAEVACAGSGATCCKFVVSNADKIKGYANHYLKLNKEKNVQGYMSRIDTCVNVIMSSQNV